MYMLYVPFNIDNNKCVQVLFLMKLSRNTLKTFTKQNEMSNDVSVRSCN